MDFVLGFGSTESQFQTNLEAEIRNRIVERFQFIDSYYFDDSFISEIANWCKSLSEKSKLVADSYEKSPDFPERYSSFYSHTIGDCNYIVVILDIAHINRHHPFSPDGWAMLTVEKTVCVRCVDLPTKKH
jgi:hypothetical protein